MLKKEHLKIYLVYLLFISGGILHLFNLFQTVMQVSTSPLLIAVSLFLIYDIAKSIHHLYQMRFLLWSLFVILFGLGIEYIGVSTHFPFGRYIYGSVLQPQLFQIPLAIGFSWLTICLSSLILATRIVNLYHIKKLHYKYIIPFFTAAFMLIFDVVMEHAAQKLDYWTWENHIVPHQNYLSWFLLGLLFTYVWLRLKLSINANLSFGIHVYLAQLIYFILVLL